MSMEHSVDDVSEALSSKSGEGKTFPNCFAMSFSCFCMHGVDLFSSTQVWGAVSRGKYDHFDGICDLSMILTSCSFW
jgi:hypothetical protein